MLEPFRRLYDMRVRIVGHVILSYKRSIERSAARKLHTAAELLSMFLADREKGKEAGQHRKFALAVIDYGSALNLLRSGYMRAKIHLMTAETAEPLDRQS